jgi:hypothetical protein
MDEKKDEEWNDEDDGELVQLNILVTKAFLKSMDLSIQYLEQDRGYTMEYGEYIEESINELVKAVVELEHKLGLTYKPLDKNNNMYG